LPRHGHLSLRKSDLILELLVKEARRLLGSRFVSSNQQP